MEMRTIREGPIGNDIRLVAMRLPGLVVPDDSNPNTFGVLYALISVVDSQSEIEG